MIKTILISLMLAVSSFALPVLNPDSQTVPSTDPRIGQVVYSIPGSQWIVWGNDNPPPLFGDQDYNDAVASIDFGTDYVSIQWIGEHSDWNNQFVFNHGVVNSQTTGLWFGLVTDGSPLAFALNTQDGSSYSNGHVNLLTERTDVPEPSTFVMLGIGAVAIWLSRKR